jgi:16S rRNA (uracil1498-N3)-methyltransferase
MLSSAMPSYDFTAPRLFVEADLREGSELALGKAQQNYLLNVLRLRPGRRVLLFNGRDGEFEAAVEAEGKRAWLRAGRQMRAQAPPASLRWLFAPLKHARLDYMVQKAVELGVGTLEPVVTRRTQVSRLNLDRMRANVVEAAEQCGILAIPSVLAERPLPHVLEGWDAAVRLVFCDEGADVADPVSALAATPEGEFAVLIGPEGGFDEEERRALLALPSVTRLALGPRILRADTAAVAALALVQAVRGDWRN